MVLTVAPYLDTLLSRNDKYFEVIVNFWNFFVCGQTAGGLGLKLVEVASKSKSPYNAFALKEATI